MIGKILKTMRRTKNITQTELSKIVKIPQNTISQYETGTIEPKFSDIERLANACGFKIYFNNNETTLTTENIKRLEI